jgi:hypothetical protein
MNRHEQIVWHLAKRPHTTQELQRKVTCAPNSVNVALTELTKGGVIIRPMMGWYVHPDHMDWFSSLQERMGKV